MVMDADISGGVTRSPTLRQQEKELNNLRAKEILPCNSDELEIEELRGRLDRRNALLDVVRKAYHRDVLVIKECLIDAQKQGLIDDVDSAAVSSLATVPSIDLREAFCLFAPQECELKVRPCWTCGGQLEIIHRESARIVNFKHSIQVLQEKEKELRLEVVDAKVKARHDRDSLVEVTERSKNERDLLLEQILSLKHQVADRNALEAEVRQLKAEKQSLEATLERQQPILDDHKQLVVGIEDVKEDANQWKTKFHEQVEQNRLLQNEKDLLANQLNLLQQENDQLQRNLRDTTERCQKFEDQCSTLTQHLSKSRAATNKMETCLRKAEQAIETLQADFQKEKQHFECKIGALESTCLKSQATISDLEGEARRNAQQAESYRKRIETTLEGAKRRGSIAFVPQCSDAAFAKTDELICELDNQRHKAALLFNLLLSCIRSTYENCLVQERLLADNGGELHRNDRKLKLSQEPANRKAQLVLGHLGSADESDVIEWTSILVNETDQRHILGNLQNRLQMGQFSLEKAFQKVYKAHAAEIGVCQDEHHAQIEERRSRIWELEQMLTDAISINRKYEDKMMKMREKYDSVEHNIDSLRCMLRKTRRECLNNNDTLSQLKEDHQKMCSLVHRLVGDLRASKANIQAQADKLTEKQQDICNRDAAIGQLEGLLQSITHKYAENERRRIKITHEVATQAIPVVADAASHADFLPTPLKGAVSTNQQENKKPGNSLLQGRMLSVQQTRWLNLQYRRAIDKL